MVSRYITVLAVLLVVFAGCAGETTDTGVPTTTVAAGDATMDTPAPGDSGDSETGVDSGDTVATEWMPYDFRAGEFYEYEFVEAGQQVGTLTWEVLSRSADGESVSVRTAGTFEGQTFETTLTGAPDMVHMNMLGTPAGAYMLVTLYSPFVGAFDGETLSVGQGWSYTDTEGTVSYAVERTDRIAGRDVFVTVLRENGVPVWEVWVDPELSLAAKSVMYDEGQVEFEVSLVDYRG